MPVFYSWEGNGCFPWALNWGRGGLFHKGWLGRKAEKLCFQGRGTQKAGPEKGTSFIVPIVEVAVEQV